MRERAYRCDRFCTVAFFFFFNDTATTEIYTLSLHDALPILLATTTVWLMAYRTGAWSSLLRDRKSTRLNSSHSSISYAVFCLKKKKKTNKNKCLQEKKQDKNHTHKHPDNT